MPAKPETKLSNKVISRLRVEGGWWVKIHGGPFQMAGIPDILGCWKGRFIAIELKIPGKEPTKLQKIVLNEIHNAGGITGVATTVEEAVSIRNGEKLFEIRG